MTYSLQRIKNGFKCYFRKGTYTNFKILFIVYIILTYLNCQLNNSENSQLFQPLLTKKIITLKFPPREASTLRSLKRILRSTDRGNILFVVCSDI